MIRPATLEDVPAITAIYNEAIREGGLTGDLLPRSLEDRRAWLEEHRNRYPAIVLEQQGEVIGYGAISPYRKGRAAFLHTGEICYYLAAAHRGRGLGRELLGELLRAAARHDFRSLLAIVLSGNRRSMGLLGEFGFHPAGLLPKVAVIGDITLDHHYFVREL